MLHVTLCAEPRATHIGPTMVPKARGINTKQVHDRCHVLAFREEARCVTTNNGEARVSTWQAAAAAVIALTCGRAHTITAEQHDWVLVLELFHSSEHAGCPSNRLSCTRVDIVCTQLLGWPRVCVCAHREAAGVRTHIIEVEDQQAPRSCGCTRGHLEGWLRRCCNGTLSSSP